jgi:hypothetical protein
MAKNLRAHERIFLLEWQDIQEVANSMRGASYLIAETADFLESVGQIRFRRFRVPDAPLTGAFYQAKYFVDCRKSNGGSFYAN